MLLCDGIVSAVIITSKKKLKALWLTSLSRQKRHREKYLCFSSTYRLYFKGLQQYKLNVSLPACKQSGVSVTHLNELKCNLKLTLLLHLSLFPFVSFFVLFFITQHMPTLAPATKDIGDSPSLESLYKDLDLYMKELDKEVAAAAAAAAASQPAAVAVSQIACQFN